MSERKKMREILQQSLAIIDNRKEDYGNPDDMFALIAKYWSTYLESHKKTAGGLAASDVAEMMTLFKIARATHGENDKTADDLIDAVGYMAFASGLRLAEPDDKIETDTKNEDRTARNEEKWNTVT